MRNHIAFVGDSFCGAYDREHWIANGSHRWQSGRDTPTWPTLVAERLNLQPHYHGYCGKSWWYSRHHFFEDCQQLIDDDEIEVIIFCHTANGRVNTISEPLTNSMAYAKTPEEKILAKAQDMWLVYLYDIEFAKWCQQNWLIEIRNKLHHVPKIIQFSCFHRYIFKEHNHYGMCFTTPLIDLQEAQYIGTEEEISHFLQQDPLANHLTDENNLRMVDFLVESIENYQPGIHGLDLSKFEIINPKFLNQINDHK